MEAIAAAGALPGLASALIQLGTATFQFYQQLHGLYKAIKYGENDLNTAIKRLDQHGDFIKELRFNFRRISNTSVSGGTRDLFERYIVESEVEVEEFRSLLNRVGKHHFKNKSWQAVETGSRLRFNERSIQKYCDLLDKQMQRFLFLQSSIQSMRVESTLSEVMETLVKQGTAVVTFYNEQSSLRQMDREPHSRLGAGLDETRPSLRGVGKSSRASSLLQEDIIPNDWHIRQVKSYSTLCGTVSVTKFSDSTASEGKKHQFAYRSTSIYRLAMRDHYHILKRHPRLISTMNLAFKPVPLLILEACGYPIPFNYAITLGHDKIFVTMAQLVPTSYAIDNIWSSRSSVSYLGHLIAMGDSAEKIKEILELGLIDLADEQCMFDRWLLGLFAPFRPEIASLLEQYLKSYKTIAFHHSFSVEYIREEFKQPPRESNMNQRQDLLRFICFYGNAAIIQQLDVAALTAIEIAGMQIFAAQGSDRELFDILMSTTGWEIHSLIHEVMELVWWNEISVGLLLQNLHLYDILCLLAQSSAFKLLLDTSSLKMLHPLSHTFGEPPVFPYPSVDGYSALMLALHCGMKPAVQILVDAGASILEPMCCGKSALSVARENTRAQHPRQWAESCDLTGKLFIPSRLRQEREAMWVLETTDRDMLEILLKALRDRGELEGEMLDDAPTPSKRGIFTSKVRHFIGWLFKPYVFDANAFRENCIYTLLWFKILDGGCRFQGDTQ
ncbi:hypothetical protein EKO27_g4177 [Xylaria grammica]|uniref:Uncharacterized protein n=1 Tax=Xylaria grammica TaxID=363999 RepID=A0A439D944_9PEZI|nr:hypothetical protein EKO27_g4177 [Xylaria grammica]